MHALVRRLDIVVAGQLREAVLAVALVIPFAEAAAGMAGKVFRILVGNAHEHPVDFHLEDQVILLRRLDEAPQRRGGDGLGHVRRELHQVVDAAEGEVAVLPHLGQLGRIHLRQRLELGRFLLHARHQVGNFRGR